MRILDWFGLSIIIVLAIVGRMLGTGGAGPDYELPRRPDPALYGGKLWDAETRDWLQEGSKAERRASLQGAFYLNEGTILESDYRGSSTGSAVSISTDGYWLTARHVIERCEKIYLQTGEDAAVPVRVSAINPLADVALLATNGAPEGLPVAATRLGKRDSFNIGFPKGAPGAVHGQFLGEMTVRHKGRNGYRERVNAWSIVSEIPRRFDSLGGLSGGAVIDDTGRIIGVVQSEQPRRGRFMTARPEALQSTIQLAGVDIPILSEPAGAAAVQETNYQTTARDLITTLRVSKVLCLNN